MTRRLLLVVLSLLLLPACIRVSVNDTDDDGARPRPTARSQSHGVEVWNLQDTPTTAAFGIPEDSVAGIYETQKPELSDSSFPVTPV